MPKQLQSFVTSPAWGFWQFVLSLIALLAVYNIYFLQKQEKALQVSYSVNSVVQVQNDLQSKIQMAYEGVPFNDIAIIDYKVENVGDVPLLESDFVEPLTFSMNPDWFMIGGNFVIPPGSKLSTEIPASPALPDNPNIPAISRFGMTPELLNPGEGWQGTMVIITRNAGSPINFNMGSHIIGVSELQKVDLSKVSVSQDTLMKRYIGIGVVFGLLIALLLWSASRFFAYLRILFTKKQEIQPNESSE